MINQNSKNNRTPVTLLYGTAPMVKHRSVIPRVKTEREVFIVREFAEIQMVNNLPLLDIKSCEDSNKRPDVICQNGGCILRIQVTELKSSDQAQATSVSRHIVKKILCEIESRNYSSKEKTLVHIVPRLEESNRAIKFKDNDIKKLVDLILDAIKEGILSPSIDELLTTSDKATPASLVYLKLPSKIKNTIRMVWLEMIPERTKCYCSGTNNIYLGVDFHLNSTNDDLLESIIDDIYRKKNRGFSDMLLIWSGDSYLFGDRDRIANMLRDRFKEISFRHVYYFCFVEADALFQYNQSAHWIV